MSEQGKRVRRISIIIGVVAIAVVILSLIGPPLLNAVLAMHGMV